MKLLLVAAGVHTLTAQPATVRALVIDGNRIVWVGPLAEAPPTEQVVDLGGAWVTPAFVDAHIHATATGLALTGVDLAGAGSVAQCLDRLTSHAAATRSYPVLIGTGWDDFGWPEQRPPRAEELARAAPGRSVLLVRVDGHSCLVDPGTLARLPLPDLEGVDRDADGAPTGLLRESASEAAQTLVRGLLTPSQLAAARRAACERAAELGIGSFHEMGHPGLSGLEDAITWATGQWPVEVVTWWAELDPKPEHGLRPGGDLFLDGSIGTGTAAMTNPYRCSGCLTQGELFHPDQAVTEFFVACTRAGRGAGVHAIGDRAIEQALRALEAAAGLTDLDAVRACRHRIEHLELPTRDQIRRMGRLGVVASVQPAFDAAWGGSDGLYAARFGPDAASDSNPLAWFTRDDGVRLAFGSDSPVTPLDPWGAVVAAERHRGGWGLGRRSALIAHTLGGRYVAGQDHVGPLHPGTRADFAVWSADPLAVDDPRSLYCLATVVCGEVVHGDLQC
ncbi:MAG: amidohydrolase [Egibacteraceae bacterium]